MQPVVVFDYNDYALQLFLSLVATAVAIVMAVIPENTKLSNATRKMYILLPGVVNIIESIVILIKAYIDNKNNIEFVDFLSDKKIIYFSLLMIFLSVFSSVSVFIFLRVFKRKILNDKQLSKYYVKLTNEQKGNGHIRIIGGSMDFLGNAPCEKAIGKLCAYNKGKNCKKCCFNNEQSKQIMRLLSEGCHIEIACTEPRDENTKKLLGFYIRNFYEIKDKDKPNIMIKYFSSEQNPNIRGRIIEDYNSTHHICWNFKTSKRGLYETPHLYNDSERMGQLVILAFDGIWKLARNLSKDEFNELMK